MAYMKHNLLKEIEIGSKNALVKKRIITHYIYNGSSTITDLSKEGLERTHRNQVYWRNV